MKDDSEESPGSAALDDKTRRDFLLATTGMVAAAGIAITAWPFIDQMNPDSQVLSEGAPVDIDISKVGPGQQITVVWRGRPIFILNRTPAELKRLQDPKNVDRLSDPNSQVHQQPKYAQNWHRSIKPEYLIVVGICTHLGCIPSYKPKPGTIGPKWPGGYFCPCHGSRYDLSARVFQGSPAPYNLPVPPHHFVKDKKDVVRIGENPPGSKFDFGSIVQI